jgi:hypothetical protein
MQRSFFSEKKESIQNIPLTDNYSINVPDKFICPISFDIMEIPVVATDGKHYSVFGLLEWFSTGSKKSPMTNKDLEKILIFDTLLYNEIRDFCTKQLETDKDILKDPKNAKALAILKRKALSLTQDNPDIIEIQRYCKQSGIKLYAFDIALPTKGNIEQEERAIATIKEYFKDSLALLVDHLPSPSLNFYKAALTGTVASLLGNIYNNYKNGELSDEVMYLFIISNLSSLLVTKMLGDFDRDGYKKFFLTSNIFSIIQTIGFRMAFSTFVPSRLPWKEIISIFNSSWCKQAWSEIAPIVDSSWCKLAFGEISIILMSSIAAMSFIKPHLRRYAGFFPQRRQEEEDVDAVNQLALEM